MATTHVRIPAEDRRQQIIDVARDLFASRGYQRTTTRELADSVGINEALLFRHFNSKEDLYWAVLQHMIEMHSRKDRLSELVHAEMSDRETFVTIAREILNRNLQFTRLLFFSALEKHELAQRFFKTYVMAYHDIVTDYIRDAMEAGRLRPMDPLLAARAFIGMFAYHFQIQELFGGKQFKQFDQEQVTTQLVDVWLEGMQPKLEQKRTNGGLRKSKKATEKAPR